MCKVFFIVGIKPQHVAKVSTLAKNMAKVMSTIEDDGVGYAAITSQGKIYGEKWLNKDQAFVIHDIPKVDPIVSKMTEMFGDTVDWVKPPATANTYQSFGERNIDIVCDTVGLILHARKATSGGKELNNVHPFFEAGNTDTPDVALIHNGQILNHDKLTKKYSTCDSEVILHEYLANQMYHNPWGMEQLAKTLVGQYTVGVLGSQLVDDVWMPYLDIFKSKKDLYGAYVPEIETMVFATTDYVLENGLKESGLTFQNMIKIKDGYLHRLNAITDDKMMDPLSFALSTEFMSHYNTQHQNSQSHRYPYQDQYSEYDAVRPKLERHHPALFTAPYLEGDMTPEEKIYFDEMDKDKATDHKALRLVASAMNGMRA